MSTNIKAVSWKRVIAVLCLAGCLAAGRAGNLQVCGAADSGGTGKQSAAVDAGSTGKQAAESGDEGMQGMSEAGGASCLAIDNQNIYAGMKTSYAGGYVPSVKKGKAVLVLPLWSRKKLARDQLTVSVTFGDAEQTPFVYKNYEKEVPFGYHDTWGGGKTGCYLVSFALQLKKDRYNGSYPVTLTAAGEDESGGGIRQEFTVYVTITDGKETGVSQGASDGTADAGFTIDSQNRYRGMARSYAKGYVPQISGDEAVVVLPLRTGRKLSGDRMTVALSFGETENQPFVSKNYEKVISLRRHKVSGTKKSRLCYLAVFHLKLKKERYNGSYPVVFSVRAEDGTGNGVRQEFTVYVTVTDGKEAGGAQQSGSADDSTPKFAPKVMIEASHFSEKTVICGKKFTAELTLRNTSRTDAVKNMLVSAAPGEGVELAGKTASDYVEELAPGAACTVSFVFRVSAAAPQGQYHIGVTMDYADARGNPYTLQGAVEVAAKQRMQVEIAPAAVPDSIQLGETVEVQVQAVNLGKGKICNVRAKAEADGLTPSGMAFIGDIEAGAAMTGSLELTADGLSGDSLYGTAQGKITFLYEDESGNEMTQEQNFETSVLSPLGEPGADGPEDHTAQWWVIMGVIVVLTAQAAAILFMRRAKHTKPRGGDV